MPPVPALSELIGQIYRRDDPIQSFLNAYTLAKANWTALRNLLLDHDLEYEGLSLEIGELLRGQAEEWQVHSALAGASDPLVGIGALLTALDIYVATRFGDTLSRQPEPYRSSDVFGGIEYWLATNSESLLARRFREFPRDVNHLHATLRRIHEHLLVTPAAFGEWRLTRVPRRNALENLFRKRIENGSFRVAVSPLCREGDIDGRSRPLLTPNLPHGFHLTSIGPPEKQRAALLHVLQVAYENHIAILVLPELRMPPELLEATRRFLREQELQRDRGLLTVVAGSWHVEANGRLVNRATLLDHFGDTLWTHDKLMEFEITPQNYEEAPDLCERIGVGPGGGCEAIHRGFTLEFYDSILGRITAATCVGFFSPAVEPLLQASGAELFLVPAMTPSMIRVEERANALVESQLAFTFSANCGILGAGKDGRSMFRCPQAGSKPHRLPSDKLLAFLDFNDVSGYNA